MGPPPRGGSSKNLARVRPLQRSLAARVRREMRVETPALSQHSGQSVMTSRVPGRACRADARGCARAGGARRTLGEAIARVGAMRVEVVANMAMCEVCGERETERSRRARITRARFLPRKGMQCVE